MNPFNTLLTAKTEEKIASGLFGLGKKGSIGLNGSLKTLTIDGPLETGVWTSGSNGFVVIEINNESHRKIVGLKVSLTRIVKTFRFVEDDFLPVSYTKKVITQREFEIQKEPINSGIKILNGNNVEWAENLEGGYKESTDAESWEGVYPAESRQVMVDLNIPVFLFN